LLLVIMTKAPAAVLILTSWVLQVKLELLVLSLLLLQQDLQVQLEPYSTLLLASPLILNRLMAQLVITLLLVVPVLS